MNSLVTGASRGVGRGIASVLASESGSHVFATGRTIAGADLPARIIRIPCDHTDDTQTGAAFRRAGDLDLLVNSAWGCYETVFEDGAFAFHLPFWHKPAHRWTAMIDAGVRATFICSAHAARTMVPRRAGLIVNISYWAAQKYLGNTIYGVSKAATDKLTADMAHGERRAGDGQEVAETLRSIVIEPIMAQAAARRMDWSAKQGLNGSLDRRVRRITKNSRKRCDRILRLSNRPFESRHIGNVLRSSRC